MAALLLEKGAQVDTRNIDGDTLLIMAAGNGHKAVVQTLIRHGANLDVKNRMLKKAGGK